MNSNQRRKAKRAFEKQWPFEYKMDWNYKEFNDRYGAVYVAYDHKKICNMESWMIQNKIKHLWDDSEKTFRFTTEKDLIWVKLKW
jgi:hypothetical protein